MSKQLLSSVTSSASMAKENEDQAPAHLADCSALAPSDISWMDSFNGTREACREIKAYIAYFPSSSLSVCLLE